MEHGVKLALPVLLFSASNVSGVQQSSRVFIYPRSPQSEQESSHETQAPLVYTGDSFRPKGRYSVRDFRESDRR